MPKKYSRYSTKKFIKRLTINNHASLSKCVCFAVTLDPLHFAVRNEMNLLFKTKRILFYVPLDIPTTHAFVRRPRRLLRMRSSEYSAKRTQHVYVSRKFRISLEPEKIPERNPFSGVNSRTQLILLYVIYLNTTYHMIIYYSSKHETVRFPFLKHWNSKIFASLWNLFYSFTITNITLNQSIIYRWRVNQLHIWEMHLHARIDPMIHKGSIKQKVLLFKLNNIPFCIKFIRESRITTNYITQFIVTWSCFKLLYARFE